MKTIFRSLSTGALLALVLAMGAVAVSAQDPCTDADGQTKWRDNFTTIFKDRTENGYKVRIETAKSGLEKYGKCESFADMTKYINDNIAKWEEAKGKVGSEEKRKALIARFNTALTSKNWDDFYASGKELMALSPNEFRDIELAFASIGFDETYNKNNTKYNDESIKYARQAIDDLQAGKTFSAKYGVPNDFVYKSKDNALGWMNLIVGYLTQVGKKDKASARAFLYKATQASASETAKNPVAYELIGSYYFDELNKVVDEIVALKAKQDKPGITEDELKQLLTDIKAKVAMSNGIAERAIDAFARAEALGQAAAYKAKMKKNVEDAYGVRFGKDKIAGLNAFVAGLTSKPFPDPTSPVTPIADPEPVTTTTTGTGVGAAAGTGVGAGNGTGTGAGNGTGMGAANGTGVGNKAAPATTTPVKNTTTTTAPKATTPAKKPGSAVKKKPAVKKTA